MLKVLGPGQVDFVQMHNAIVPSPLFSVIIPTRDRPALLEEALASVVSQTVRDWECLVIDDGSEPPVPRHEDPRIVVVRHEQNAGVAAARNTGLRHAQGTYVTFLDDDDAWTPSRLHHALRGLAEAPVAICGRVGSDGTTGGNRKLHGHVHDVILNALTPHLGQVALRRDVAPLFDEAFAGSQDIDWWLRLTGRVAVTTTPETGLWYRVHAGVRKGNDTSRRVAAGLLLLDKHRGYFATHRRARAFRWKRIGIMAAKEGDRRLALWAFLRSTTSLPDVSVLMHLGRLIRPRR